MYSQKMNNQKLHISLYNIHVSREQNNSIYQGNKYSNCIFTVSREQKATAYFMISREQIVIALLVYQGNKEQLQNFLLKHQCIKGTNSTCIIIIYLGNK